MDRRLLLLVLALAACGPRSYGTPVPVRPLGADPAAEDWYRRDSGYAQRERLLVRTEEDWQAAWSTLVQGMPSAPPAPAVDFEREMLVVAALGERPLLGYGIRITDAELVDGTLLVLAFDVFPNDRCPTVLRTVTPADVVRLDRYDGPVTVLTYPATNPTCE